MKKLVSLLMAVLLLTAMVSFACAEAADKRQALNPNGYTMIEICDTWIEDDTGDYIVQGSFGERFYYGTNDEEVKDGFDPQEAYPLVLSPNAVVELPDADGNVVPSTIEALFTMTDAQRSEKSIISIFCEFKMNAAGELTRLTYSSNELIPNYVSHNPSFYNPNNYSLLRVVDAYQCDDDDYCVLGTFGEFDYSDEVNPKVTGFDGEGMLLTIAKDAVIEMSPNLAEEENVVMTAEQYMQLEHDMLEKYEDFTYYCSFEMDAEGNLTKLVYVYLP